MEKTGEVKDVDAEAAKLLETMNGPKAELTKILLDSPPYISQLLQDALDQLID